MQCVCYSLCQKCLTRALSVPSFSFVTLLVCRTNDGINPGADHLDLFNKAVQFSNIIALDDTKPHTLPPGWIVFRVHESKVTAKNL